MLRHAQPIVEELGRGTSSRDRSDRFERVVILCVPNVSALTSQFSGDYCANPGEKTVNSFGEKMICKPVNRRKAWVRYVVGASHVALKLSIVKTTKNTNAAYNIFDVSWESPSSNVTNSNVIYWSSTTSTVITNEKRTSVRPVTGLNIVKMDRCHCASRWI